MSETKISDIVARVLLTVGVVDRSEMPELIAAVANTGIPLGRILVMRERLTEDQLQSALTAAKLVLCGHGSISKAAILLAYSYFCHTDIACFWRRVEFKYSDTVAVILFASGSVGKSKMEELARQGTTSHRIGGRELYRAGLITLEQWQKTLERALLLSRGQRTLLQEQGTPDDCNARQEVPAVLAPEENPGRFGQLLLQADLIGQEELLYALELGLESGEAIGQILVLRGTITTLALRTVLRLQHLINAGSIDVSQAVTYLKLVPQGQVARRRMYLAA